DRRAVLPPPPPGPAVRDPRAPAHAVPAQAELLAVRMAALPTASRVPNGAGPGAAPRPPAGRAAAGPRLRRLIRRASALAGWPVRLQWFVTNVAPVEAGGSPVTPPGVAVRVGTPEDAVALAPFVRGRQSLAGRLGGGAIVLVAELAGQVIGCSWLPRRALRPWYFPIRVRPSAEAWYNYGLVLAREHRVRELGRMLSRMAMVHAGRH